MRCHFNLIHAALTIADREGAMVHDLDEALRVAHELVAEMIKDGAVRGADLNGWRLEAVSASGALLFTIGLDALLV